MKYILLRTMGKIYEWTGWFCPLARIFENYYIIENLTEFYSKWEENKHDDLDFLMYISVQKGIWQCKYGFYRQWKLNRPINKKYKV